MISIAATFFIYFWQIKKVSIRYRRKKTQKPLEPQTHITSPNCLSNALLHYIRYLKINIFNSCMKCSSLGYIYHFTKWTQMCNIFFPHIQTDTRIKCKSFKMSVWMCRVVAVVTSHFLLTQLRRHTYIHFLALLSASSWQKKI